MPASASPPEVAAPAASYLRILNWGTLPLLIYAASRRYLQGVGQVRVITVTFVGANLLNWLGNWVLIYGKWGAAGMGVAGSALSTVVARVFMALALLGFAWRYERKRGHPLFRHWAGPSLDKAPAADPPGRAGCGADCARSGRMEPGHAGGRLA
jgi:MATE family multidrug resistance protein